MNKNAVTSVQPKSSSIPDTNKEEEKQEQLLQRKISLATEGFATIKYRDTHLVKLELLSNVTTIDNALHYIRNKQQEQHKRLALDFTSNDNNNDSQITSTGKQTVF
ncbi:MAG: hypothetical protein ACJ71R_11585 [Nitrososphaeraceae archaeon]